MNKTKTNTTRVKYSTKNVTKKHIKKPNNWSEYNKALQNRGNISIYIQEAIVNDAFTVPIQSRTVGHPKEYSDPLILLILTIRELFRLPLRQSVGFTEYLFDLMKIDAPLPDYSTISRRMGSLDIDFSHGFHGKDIVLLIDSSGFKVFGEGEWKVKKHGSSYRRTWRETHIAIDYKTRNIISVINTKANVHDNTQLRPLLHQAMKDHEISTVIGDGAYDAKDNYSWGRKLGIEFIAPPPCDATTHMNMYHYQLYDKPGWEERNAVIRHIEEFGLDGWKTDINYHRRSLVENTFSRLKTIFGSNLKSRKEENQDVEQCIRVSLINRFNKMGLPRYDIVR